MTNKKFPNINTIRDSAISVRIGNKDDGSHITKMIGVGDTMYCVKETSIWGFKLADAIDPKRTNASIPNVQQEFLSIGSKSEYVLRTLIQANELLQPRLYKVDLDRDRLMQVALDALKSFSALVSIADAAKRERDAGAAQIKHVSESKNLSLPKYANLESDWKLALSSMDAVRAAIREMAFAFYPNQSKKNDWFDALSRELGGSVTVPKEQTEKISGEIDQILALVRWMRNFSEHSNTDKYIELKDFSLQQTGLVDPPTIRLVGRTAKIEEYHLHSFLPQIIEALLVSFETILIWLCDANLDRKKNKYIILQRDRNDALSRQCGIFGFGIELHGKVHEISAS